MVVRKEDALEVRFFELGLELVNLKLAQRIYEGSSDCQFRRKMAMHIRRSAEAIKGMRIQDFETVT